MIPVDVDGIRFEFPDTWQVCKWDDTAFHARFQNVGGGSKSCDIVALPPEGEIVWLVEVKDYSRHRREKQIDLFDEVGCKVRDTLAALWAAQRNANTAGEWALAREARRRRQIRVAFHCETPRLASRLAPTAGKQAADVLDKLKHVLRAIDPHPVVTRIGDMRKVDWQASHI